MPTEAPPAVQDRQHGPAQLPPGSELDARIARALGWQRNATAEYPWRWKDDAGHTRALPAYSRNAEVAVNLLGYLINQGWPIVFRHGWGNVLAVTGPHSAEGISIPHAISLLAVQLLEKEAQNDTP